LTLDTPTDYFKESMGYDFTQYYTLKGTLKQA